MLSSGWERLGSPVSRAAEVSGGVQLYRPRLEVARSQCGLSQQFCKVVPPAARALCSAHPVPRPGISCLIPSHSDSPLHCLISCMIRFLAPCSAHGVKAYGLCLLLTEQPRSSALPVQPRLSCILVQVQKLHGIGMRLTKAGAATLALEDYAEEHQRVILVCLHLCFISTHAIMFHKTLSFWTDN